MQNLELWTKETIVEEIVRSAHGHESLYRANITIVRTGPLSVNIEFEYNKNNKPIGIFLERGTKPHKIFPRIKKALHWVTTQAARPFFPQFNKVKGNINRDHFALMVNHPGTTGLRAMDLGAQYGMPKLMKRIIVETNQFLQESKIY